MVKVKIWDKEIKGKVYAVGDIHGCYNLLMTKLAEIGFDFENDLLVAVGDLVDRGVQNLECVDLLDQDWFTSICGNHEDLCIGGLDNDAFKRCHLANGGEWFYDLNHNTQCEIALKFSRLPTALEVNHNGRKYGFVHGHIEQNNWDEFKQSLLSDDPLNEAHSHAMWRRDRVDVDNDKYTHVSGVDAVIMGHTVMQKPMKRDNCYYIDTGAVHWGTMTILDLAKI
ncbi:metallophosphoesterase [Acinetobacter rudis]|uniref:metallophosphoesterase n=1 Tax=Acinetobacter rudis TaxID=632955 RepID=UPI00333F232E